MHLDRFLRNVDYIAEVYLIDCCTHNLTQAAKYRTYMTGINDHHLL